MLQLFNFFFPDSDIGNAEATAKRPVRATSRECGRDFEIVSK
jgi:hypothetical protein